MRLVIAVQAFFVASVFAQTVTPPFSYGGHTYNITSSSVGVFLTSSTIEGGVAHWLYEPSVITPSNATNNQWVMLFATNLSAAYPGPEAVFMVTSDNGTTPSGTPTQILTNSPANVCDMIDARPIWDGSSSTWHVFIQVAPWMGLTCGGDPNGTAPNFIGEAAGPSLTSLSWILDNGTNNATQILHCDCTSGVGIGEGQQWFNTGPYGGYPPTPYMTLYNNWAYVPGNQIFSYLTDFSSYNYAYDINPPWIAATGETITPDVILASPDGTSSGTNFGLGVGSYCNSSTNYSYMDNIGFFAHIQPYPGSTPHDVLTVVYATASVSSDSTGQHGFTPRFARNAYGYLDLTSTSPNTWTTYVYYDDASVTGCNLGQSFKSGNNRFSVSQITITQQ
jgi:hypothetical protein